MSGATPGGALRRHHLWRLVFASTGGLTVTGPLPRGPAVLVANHSSHADTAALMAAIPAAGLPVFAAAADYWFARPMRRFLVTTLAAAVPVERHEGGAYAALLEACAPVVASGGIVIVYPEGTRTKDGAIGEFASGAVRLADDLHVPVIPAAVLGTRDMLPKNGSFSAKPVEIRFADAFDASGLGRDRSSSLEGSGRLRDAVVAQRERGPVADPRSPLGERVKQLVDSPAGIVVAFTWGFAEALSWPVIAEMSIAFFAITSPRRVVRWSMALAAGSVSGVVVNAALARRGVTLPAPLTTARMRRSAARHLSTGAWGIRHQAFNGIPVKVYAVEAVRAGIPLSRLAVAAGVERTGRIVGVGVVASAVSVIVRAPVRRRYGTYAAVAIGVWVVGVAQVRRRWS